LIVKPWPAVDGDHRLSLRSTADPRPAGRSDVIATSVTARLYGPHRGHSRGGHRTLPRRTRRSRRL